MGRALAFAPQAIAARRITAMQDLKPRRQWIDSGFHSGFGSTDGSLGYFAKTLFFFVWGGFIVVVFFFFCMGFCSVSAMFLLTSGDSWSICLA